MYPFCVYFRLCIRPTMLDYLMPIHDTSSFLHADHLHVKGGYLSIATQGSYWLSSPHPLALSTASRPGIPATAETSSRAKTRGCRVPASNQICRNTSQDTA